MEGAGKVAEAKARGVAQGEAAAGGSCEGSSFHHGALRACRASRVRYARALEVGGLVRWQPEALQVVVGQATVMGLEA